MRDRDFVSAHISRRQLLLRGLQLSAGVVAGSALAACGGKQEAAKAAHVCADPGNLSTTESNTRAAVGYVEASPDPQSVCAGCAFFHAPAASEACGRCDMFNGGPVNPGGHCRSWTARPAGSDNAA
jgi:High potential iron-sulfur protein